jgi:hypothetical protein
LAAGFAVLEFLLGSREHRPDAVDGQMQGGANLFVRASFEIEEPDHFAFAHGQAAEQALDFFEGFETAGGLGALGGVAVATFGGDALGSTNELLNADASSDYGQVCSQAALAAKLAQDLIVIGDDLEEHFGGEVFDVFGLKRDAALMGGEMDDVVDQTEIAINEIVPSTAMMLQAALKQRSIDGRERHALTLHNGGGTGPSNSTDSRGSE